jgi:type VII secretion integral membrane protein EccD
MVLTIVGIVLARAGADAGAGATLAGSGLLYAFAGGLVVSAPDVVSLTGLGAPHLLVGSASLVVFGVAGSIGVAAAQRVFIGAVGAGLVGGLAGLLCMVGMSPSGAAAVSLTLAIGLLPGYPLAASSLGKLPVPPLPERPEDILDDRPAPRRSVVFAAVARAHELLSGMLLAAAVVSFFATIVLVQSRGVAGELLCLAGALALLLRGRLFPTPVQRIPLLVSGLAGLTVLTVGLILRMPGPGRLLPALLIAFVAGLVLTAGLLASRRAPSPYVGRIADLVDVLAIMALIPLACAVIGVFNAIQGIFASIGG